MYRNSQRVKSIVTLLKTEKVREREKAKRAYIDWSKRFCERG